MLSCKWNKNTSFTLTNNVRNFADLWNNKFTDNTYMQFKSWHIGTV